jgi:hypothetical protein
VNSDKEVDTEDANGTDEYIVVDVGVWAESVLGADIVIPEV